MTEKEAMALVETYGKTLVIQARQMRASKDGWEVSFVNRADGKEIHARGKKQAVKLACSGNVLRTF